MPRRMQSRTFCICISLLYTLAHNFSCRSTANACFKDAADLHADLEEYPAAIARYEQVADHSLGSALTKYSVKEYWLRALLCCLAIPVSPSSVYMTSSGHSNTLTGRRHCETLHDEVQRNGHHFLIYARGQVHWRFDRRTRRRRPGGVHRRGLRVRPSREAGQLEDGDFVEDQEGHPGRARAHLELYGWLDDAVLYAYMERGCSSSSLHESMRTLLYGNSTDIIMLPTKLPRRACLHRGKAEMMDSQQIPKEGTRSAAPPCATYVTLLHSTPQHVSMIA